MLELTGRRVLVTGASRGIGRALVERFAAEGARLALVARNEGAIKELADQVGGTAHPVDLCEPEQIEGLVARVEEDGGPLDVLVNNAGAGPASWLATASADDIRSTCQLNLLTPMELCRQAIPRMLERGRGHVVNISSLAGTAVFPGLSIYSATKSGLSHFTAGLRADLRGLPVGTTLVELGPVPTDMYDGVADYPPAHDSFRRFYRLGLLVDIPKEKVAEQVVAAVKSGRKHVRLPRRAALFPILTEAPRRMVELLLTGVRHRA